MRAFPVLAVALAVLAAPAALVAPGTARAQEIYPSDSIMERRVPVVLGTTAGVIAGGYLGGFAGTPVAVIGGAVFGGYLVNAWMLDQRDNARREAVNRAGRTVFGGQRGKTETWWAWDRWGHVELLETATDGSCSTYMVVTHAAVGHESAEVVSACVRTDL
jgi:uncharacterized protein YcfJ